MSSDLPISVDVRVVVHRRLADIDLVRIPGGTFLMGTADDDEEGYEDERPQHSVTLDSFYLARTPVTNAQYARFLAQANVPVPEYWGNPKYNQPEQPVVGVSWGEALAFCKWAGLILPTEAQWEYAARAGTTTQYWSGDEEDDLARVGWYLENSGERLHSVGELPANPFGLHDVHGNVWEWCRDNYYSYRTPPKPGDGLRHDPTRLSERIVRGGSFSWGPSRARSAFRDFQYPTARWSTLGFRPARAIGGG